MEYAVGVRSNPLRRRAYMKFRFLLSSVSLAILASASSIAWAQLPPLGEPAKPGAPAPAGGLSVDAINADLKAASAANQEKRYADAESLMLRDTAARGDLVLLWVQLGTAQIGLKKYPEAEVSFNNALGANPGPQKASTTGSFYQPDAKPGAVAPTATRASSVGASGTTVTKQNRTPEVLGAALTGLGEVYIRTSRIPDAQAAFDQAAKENPAQAAFYLRNETILFLQTGHAAEQVDAATKALALDPKRADLYFFKGQGLAAQATVDTKTQKLVLPAGCAEALQKYLDLDPTGQYSTDAKGMLTAAGVPIKAGKK
jgi:tetratricopeptide (TPR) repeat protein